MKKAMLALAAATALLCTACETKEEAPVTEPAPVVEGAEPVVADPAPEAVIVETTAPVTQ